MLSINQASQQLIKKESHVLTKHWQSICQALGKLNHWPSNHFRLSHITTKVLDFKYSSTLELGFVKNMDNQEKFSTRFIHHLANLGRLWISSFNRDQKCGFFHCRPIFERVLLFLFLTQSLLNFFLVSSPLCYTAA